MWQTTFLMWRPRLCGAGGDGRLYSDLGRLICFVAIELVVVSRLESNTAEFVPVNHAQNRVLSYSLMT